MLEYSFHTFPYPFLPSRFFPTPPFLSVSYKQISAPDLFVFWITEHYHSYPVQKPRRKLREKLPKLIWQGCQSEQGYTLKKYGFLLPGKQDFGVYIATKATPVAQWL